LDGGRRLCSSWSTTQDIQATDTTTVGGYPVGPISHLKDTVDRGGREAVSHPVIREPLTIESAQTVARRKPEKPLSIPVDADDEVVRQAIGGRVATNRQALAEGRHGERPDVHDQTDRNDCRPSAASHGPAL
jgi:hypothetical protein